MTNKQALEVVTAASLEFRGTRKDHEAIALALDTLNKLVSPPVVTPAPDNVIPINN
jgi:hypothetical protein